MEKPEEKVILYKSTASLKTKNICNELKERLRRPLSRDLPIGISWNKDHRVHRDALFKMICVTLRTDHWMPRYSRKRAEKVQEKILIEIFIVTAPHTAREILGNISLRFCDDHVRNQTSYTMMLIDLFESNLSTAITKTPYSK